MMQESIFELAQTISGAGEKELPLLEQLCVAAEMAWLARLRDGMNAEDCGAAFRCAAAFTAAADLMAGRNGGHGVSSFTAGEISVKTQGAAETAGTVKELRRSAERLMAPYTKNSDVWLKGVRG